MKELKDEDTWSNRAKIHRFLAQKGYEDTLIHAEIAQLLK